MIQRHLNPEKKLEISNLHIEQWVTMKNKNQETFVTHGMKAVFSWQIFWVHEIVYFLLPKVPTQSELY